jgi:hypothetical protein
MARKGLTELVVDTTSKHYAVLLHYRTKCCRQGLTLPPQSKQENNTIYICHFWGVNYSKTLQEDMLQQDNHPKYTFLKACGWMKQQ